MSMWNDDCDDEDNAHALNITLTSVFSIFMIQIRSIYLHFNSAELYVKIFIWQICIKLHTYLERGSLILNAENPNFNSIQYLVEITIIINALSYSKSSCYGNSIG